MYLVGQLITRFDPRAIVLLGLGLSATAIFWMTHFSLQMDSGIMVWSGLIQGLGMGMIFVPLSTLAFATLSPGLRGEGAAVYTLVRSMGSAIGISLMQAQHASSLQANHARLAEHIRPDAPNLHAYSQLDLSTSVGAALSDAMITRQAAMMTYVHDFQLLLVMTLALAPLLLIVRKPRGPAPGDMHVVVE
jgi:DHA2 family multidrug resistance protein